MCSCILIIADHALIIIAFWEILDNQRSESMNRNLFDIASRTLTVDPLVAEEACTGILSAITSTLRCIVTWLSVTSILFFL